jgi:hypothetical protein
MHLLVLLTSLAAAQASALALRSPAEAAASRRLLGCSTTPGTIISAPSGRVFSAQNPSPSVAEGSVGTARGRGLLARRGVLTGAAC